MPLTDSVVPLYALIQPEANAQDRVNLDQLLQYNSQSNPDLGTVSEAALKVSESTSPAKGSVVEKQQSLKALRWEALPALVPSARYDSSNSDPFGGSRSNSVYRLGLLQPLLDFGKHAGRTEQAMAEISLAKIEHWQERNQAVHDALSNYIELFRYRELLALSELYVEKHKTLQSQIIDRIQGGVAERSERSLIDIRLQELNLQKNTDYRKLEAKRQEFEDQTELATAAMPQLLTGMTNDIGVNSDFSHSPPPVLWAEQNVQLAHAKRKEAKSGILPSLTVEAYVENADDDTYQGVELNIVSTSFAGFSHRAKLRSANAAVDTARTAVTRANRDYDRESSRLTLEYENMLARKASLDKQHQQLQKAVDLFFEQFKSGVKPILDAISVYESVLDMQRQLIDVEADIRRNRLETSNLNGTIAPFPES